MPIAPRTSSTSAALRLAAGQEHREAGVDGELPGGRGEALRRVAARRGRGAGVDEDPGAIRVDAQPRDDPPHPAAGPLRDAQRHPFVGRPGADGGHQVELPAHLVADEAVGLGVGHPVGQQRVRVLPAVGQPQGDVRQVAEEGRRQGALAVDGEDDRRVESPAAEPVGHLRLGRLSARGAVAFIQGAS
jgi:hypothetical protein